MPSDLDYLTLQDRLNLCLFEPQSPPAIVVEGDTDLPVVSRLLKISSQLSGLNPDFVVAGNKEAVLRAVADGALVFNYVAILDKDHDEFFDLLVDEPKILYTHFYSIESYLTRRGVVEAAVNSLANHRDAQTYDYDIMMNGFRAAIDPLLLLLIARVRLKGKWLSVKVCDVSVWKVASSATLELDQERALKWRDSSLEEAGLSVADFQREAAFLQEVAQTADEDDLLSIVPGRQVLDYVYFYFSIRYPEFAAKRSKKCFMVDLCCHVQCDCTCTELVEKIEDVLGPNCS